MFSRIPYQTAAYAAFLFAAFLLIETLEHYSTTFINQTLIKINKAGPLVGAILGCIPQCGFSVMSANLYSSGVVSLGTMLAVFLATSDEAILLLLGHPESAGSIWTLLAAKLLIAVIARVISQIYFWRSESPHRSTSVISATTVAAMSITALYFRHSNIH